MNAHPTALVHELANIDPSVEIGPYCIVGPHVTLGKNVKLHSHVILEQHVNIGEGTQVFPFATIGKSPQSRLSSGEEIGYVEIGCHNMIREHVTIHYGIERADKTTRIGNNNHIMVGCHIAHDCQLANNIQMANHVSLGGLVHLEDYVVIGGLSAIHQKVRIGAHAMVSGTAGVNEDVMPFGTVLTVKSKLGGLNLIGMKRRGFSRDEIHEIRGAYRILAKDYEGTLNDKIELIRNKYKDSRPIRELLAFIDTLPQRHLCLPHEEWDFEKADEIYDKLTQVSVA